VADNRTDYDELKELARCVHMYFREQKQQQEIARALGVSASKVSRLVKRAYSEGWVAIDFQLPKLPLLAAGLIERYGLRDAEVIASGEATQSKKDLGAAAARYFERTTGNGACVGISCGLTLYHLVDHLRERRIKDLKLYPLSTEAALSFVDLIPNTLVGIMAAKYRPHVSAFALPTLIVGSERNARRSVQALLKDAEIKRIYDEMHNVDIALIGIGTVDIGTPGFCSLAKQFDFSPARLETLGVVGEFNYQPIDGEGRVLRLTELKCVADRIIGVSGEHLKTIGEQDGKRVIGIGGGVGKLNAIRSVLKGKLCNVLITDQEAAEALLL
jgi:deoxyribonucleoside regulator